MRNQALLPGPALSTPAPECTFNPLSPPLGVACVWRAACTPGNVELSVQHSLPWNRNVARRRSHRVPSSCVVIRTALLTLDGTVMASANG
jgi:hypothetical protein